jgi:hypothetical protein
MITMFNKLLVSLFIITSIVAATAVNVLAANAEQHHPHKSHKIVFSKLTINPSNSRLLNLPLHFCPVHGRVMKGAFCKMKNMKHASINEPDPESRDKEECFISTDAGGFPLRDTTVVLSLDFKFDLSTMSGMALTLPCRIFICSEFKDYSQEYFNSPDKPPEYQS